MQEPARRRTSLSGAKKTPTFCVGVRAERKVQRLAAETFGPCRRAIRHFFFGAGFLAGALAFAFFLSLPCALLPFAMINSFQKRVTQASFFLHLM